MAKEQNPEAEVVVVLVLTPKSYKNKINKNLLSSFLLHNKASTSWSHVMCPNLITWIETDFI